MSTIKSSAENLTLNADGANNDVIIQSNGSTKVTVDGQNSRVGIGTTSPQNPLEISGNTNYLMRLTQTGTNKHMLKTVGNGASLELLCDGANNYVGLNSTTNGDDIRFQTNDGNERMRMLAAGGLTFNGDTAAANALDDYEEGTWTPVIAGTTGNHTISGTSNYTKIGRLVTVNSYIYNGQNIGNTAAEWNFTGLPYAPIRDAVCSVRFHSVNVPSDVKWCIVQVQTGTNGLEVWGNRDNSSVDILQWSDIGTGHVEFTCTYQATS